MAGHSKWANIQHRKNKQDAKRGKVFTKLIRAITVAARMGGGDTGSNSRLRDAMYKARLANMTNDTIDRAIKKGTGESGGAAMEAITYEGYGPGGVAVMVECLTDNRNRTVGEVRHAFTKCGGNLGTDGSVAYLFSEKGQISLEKSNREDDVIMIAIDNGADDVVTNDDGSIDVTTSQEKFRAVQEALQGAGFKPVFAEVTLVSSNQVNLDKDDAEKMLRLQDMLDDLDDVQEVYSNADIDPAFL